MEMSLDEIQTLFLAIDPLVAEEDARLLEVCNYSDYNKETQRKIRQRLERPFAKTIAPHEMKGLL